MTVIPLYQSNRPVAATVDDELARLKGRDPAAWSDLFERDHARVFRAVLVQVRDRSVAEDITGQVFLEALQSIGRYRDRGKPLTAWLLAIARHRSLDWHRKRRREAGRPAPEPSTPGPEHHVDAALEALDQLTPEQREVVELRFVEGYDLAEVASLLGRSVGSVKALQHRAIARLRRQIAGTEED